MYVESGKLIVNKGLMTFDAFLDAYKPHETKKAVLHFRIRTHGNVNEDNCHPFVIDPNLAFVHNGTISNQTCDIKEMSDTWHFNRDILQPLRERDRSFFQNKVYLTLLKNYIGFSKLIFMNSKAQVTIVNEAAGDWNSGCWFSNSSWKATSYSFSRRRSHHSTSSSGYSGSDIMDQSGLDYDEDGVLILGDPKKEDKSPQLPVKATRKEELTVGDVCYLKYPINELKTAEYVTIKYIYSDNTVGVHKRLERTKEYRIPFWYLEKTSIQFPKEDEEPVVYKPGDVVMFNSNYNHFRAFDDVEVVEDFGVTVKVRCHKSNKDYFIHKSKIDLFNILKDDKVVQTTTSGIEVPVTESVH